MARRYKEPVLATFIVLVSVGALVAVVLPRGKTSDPWDYERDAVIQFAEETRNLYGPPRPVQVLSVRHVFRSTYKVPGPLGRCAIDVWDVTTAVRREWISVGNPAVVTKKTPREDYMGVTPLTEYPTFQPLIPVSMQISRQDGSFCSE